MGPTATGTAVWQGVDAHRRRPRSGSVSRQIAQQRRGYAGAVLRALARTHRGRPPAVVQRILREALTPLGVRLSGAELHDLAASISATRLPEPSPTTGAASRYHPQRRWAIARHRMQLRHHQERAQEPVPRSSLPHPDRIARKQPLQLRRGYEPTEPSG